MDAVEHPTRGSGIAGEGSLPGDHRGLDVEPTRVRGRDELVGAAVRKAAGPCLFAGQGVAAAFAGARVAGGQGPQGRVGRVAGARSVRHREPHVVIGQRLEPFEQAAEALEAEVGVRDFRAGNGVGARVFARRFELRVGCEFVRVGRQPATAGIDDGVDERAPRFDPVEAQRPDDFRGFRRLSFEDVHFPAFGLEDRLTVAREVEAGWFEAGEPFDRRFFFERLRVAGTGQRVVVSDPEIVVGGIDLQAARRDLVHLSLRDVIRVRVTTVYDVPVTASGVDVFMRVEREHFRDHPFLGLHREVAFDPFARDDTVRVALLQQGRFTVQIGEPDVSALVDGDRAEVAQGARRHRPGRQFFAARRKALDGDSGMDDVEVALRGRAAVVDEEVAFGQDRTLGGRQGGEFHRVARFVELDHGGMRFVHHEDATGGLVDDDSPGFHRPVRSCRPVEAVGEHERFVRRGPRGEGRRHQRRDEDSGKHRETNAKPGHLTSPACPSCSSFASRCRWFRATDWCCDGPRSDRPSSPPPAGRGRRRSGCSGSSPSCRRRD